MALSEAHRCRSVPTRLLVSSMSTNWRVRHTDDIFGAHSIRIIRTPVRAPQADALVGILRGSSPVRSAESELTQCVLNVNLHRGSVSIRRRRSPKNGGMSPQHR